MCVHVAVVGPRPYHFESQMGGVRIAVIGEVVIVSKVELLVRKSQIGRSWRRRSMADGRRSW